ncbi:MAG: MFS transporter [Myxococcales bacterium]|nr:MFS transporter [Myxococcales bacterium]
MIATFRSLSGFNYRLWAGGALVSNVGTWMQRTAQDWLVLTGLTDHNATAVGSVMALQFGPRVLLLPLTGYAADRFELRKLLYVTQGLLALLALGLGLLTLGGSIQLWHVHLFALGLGCVTAFDAPARQAFVSELVEPDQLPSAVGLNSTSFNAARMIGPAVAGVLIAGVGTGWVFLLNAASFVAVLLSLTQIRAAELQPRRSGHPPSKLFDGFVYVWKYRELRGVMLMFCIIGTFALNLPIFVSTMSAVTFGRGAGEYGLATSVMAVGSVIGALFVASQSFPSVRRLSLSCAAMACAFALASLAPSYLTFCAALVLVGGSVQSFTTGANSFIQLNTEPAMRGRVLAIMIAVALGTTPVGAPLVGWIADHLSPRWSLGVGALAGLFTAGLGAHYLRAPEAGSGAPARSTPPRKR